MSQQDVDHEDFLTDEERAALEDGDVDEETSVDQAEIDAEEAEAEQIAEAAKEESAKETPAAEEPAAAKEDPAKEAPAKKEEVPASEEEAAAKEEPAKANKFTASDDYDPDLKDSLEELKKKRDDGDLDFDEYQDQRDRIVRDQTARDFNRNEATNAAISIEAAYFKDNPTFHPATNPMKFGVLNDNVIALQGDPDWQTKPYREILDEATNRVHKAFGIAPPEKKDTEEKTNPRPRQDIKAPASVSDLPADDDTELSGDEYAHLDNMTPIELEDALARLPEAQREHYLSR